MVLEIANGNVTVELDPIVPLGRKDVTWIGLLMNWQFIFGKTLLVVAVGDEGEGGVAKSNKEVDKGTSTSA